MCQLASTADDLGRALLTGGAPAGHVAAGQIGQRKYIQELVVLSGSAQSSYGLEF